MPRISFWTIFTLFGIVSQWAEKALEDGVITLTEAAGLAEDLGPVLGIPVQIEIPAPTSFVTELSPEEETESAAPKSIEEKPTDNTTDHKPVV